MDRKIIFRWVKLFLLAYGVIGIIVYYVQDKFILHPSPLPAGTPYRFSQPAVELNLNYDIETNLNVVEFKATDRPADSVAPGANGLEKGVVLFFHDGRGNIGDYVGMAPGITSHGYELWMMDYPGFGKSTGSMDEKRLYDLARVFYKLARSRWKPSEIVIEGQGFGTGVAAQLGAARDCRRLVLDRPFYSMTSVFRRYLFIYPLGGRFLHYHLPINEYLPKVTAPIILIGGDSALKAFLKPGDQFLDNGDVAAAAVGP